MKILNKDKKLNKTKQVTAFMPNLIHSLDASSLMLLLNSFFNYNLNDIYTIHDCFAVTCNNASFLIDLIKLVYIKLYSDEIYLLKLDQQILNNIKNVRII